MAQTVIRGTQILNNTVQRQDLDTSTVGQAVVTKIVQGSGVTLSSTGADSGTGDVTVSTSAIPLASSSTSGLMNQTSGNTTDFIDGTNNSQALQPVIWSVRLRSFNAVGNSSLECNQRRTGGTLAANGYTWIADRWIVYNNTGVAPYCDQAYPVSPVVHVPGTNFRISQAALNFSTQATSKPSLAAGDQVMLYQTFEGIQLRELVDDVHSLSLLVFTTAAGGLKFAVSLRDPNSTYSLVKLCTIPTPNAWSLISLSNLPTWTSNVNWGNTAVPGTAAYVLSICLAAGSTNIAPATDVWVSGNYVGAAGMDNILSKPNNTQFMLGFVQHEPGALCSTPIDCPFTRNYDDCLRYFQKTNPYGTKPGSGGYPGACSTGWIPGGNSPAGFVAFKKPMAKIPTITGYSPQTGAANNVTDTGTDRAISSTIDIGDAGFGGFTISSTNSGFTWMRFHYTADTGW